MNTPTYHDLYIETNGIPRTPISDLPYGLEVSCTRVGGWQLRNAEEIILAEEYTKRYGLKLDVNGYVIVDSLTTPYEREE